MPIFKIATGQSAGGMETVHSSRIIIGRSPDCGLLIADNSIDMAHASIEARANEWVLQDLGTPGGTWLNNQPVYRPISLQHGDYIRLNEVLLQFERCPEENFIDWMDDYSADWGGKVRTWWQGSGLRMLLAGVGLSLLVMIAFLASLLFASPSAVAEEAIAPGVEGLPAQTEIAAVGETIYFLPPQPVDTNLDRIEFWANDELIEIVRPNSGLNPMAPQAWVPEVPGTYQLRTTAYSHSGEARDVVLTVTVN